MRRVVVEANVRGRDLGGFVSQVQESMKEIEASLPSGYFVRYGGQFENQQRAMRQLAIVVPIVLVLIALLLYSALGSVRNSALVILNLPFALVGGLIAAVAFRMHLSVSAAVAFIVLLGIAVQNGVVLLAFFRQLKERGCGARQTVIEGCRLRFKPLFMTALVSFIGHLPMLYATGSGADIQKPLAVVVMGGLVTSTLLTLIVLPVVYYWLETRRSAAAEVEATSARIRSGVTPAENPRRRRNMRMFRIPIATLFLALMLPACGDDPAKPSNDLITEVTNELVFTRQGGATIDFGAGASTYIWCGPWESDVPTPALARLGRHSGTPEGVVAQGGRGRRDPRRGDRLPQQFHLGPAEGRPPLRVRSAERGGYEHRGRERVDRVRSARVRRGGSGGLHDRRRRRKRVRRRISDHRARPVPGSGGRGAAL